MEKTIKLGEKEVTLSNNVTWFIKYRNQFGKDMVQTLTPALASVLDIIGAIDIKVDDDGNLDFGDSFKVLNGDTVTDIMLHAGGLEFVDLLNIVWAMAKVKDPSIKEPEEWYKDFDVFPLDEIAPDLFELITAGLMTSKNFKGLQEKLKKLRKALKPKKQTSTRSSSPQQKED